MSFPTDPQPDDAPTLRHRHAPLDPNADPDARATLSTRKPPPPEQNRPWVGHLNLIFSILAVVLSITIFLIAVVLRHDMRANLLANENLLDGHVAVAGLTAPVTVTRNAQNVPSIHATNLDDLLFAQGYITASDRLFQMDALRRHGAGTLAEILGPSLIQHDREQRILQLRAAADRAAAILPPGQLHQLQAYARGVNAYITTHNGSNGPNTLPIEFHILHYTPALWQPRDTLLITLVMAQDLSTDFPTKLNREALAANLPANLLPDLYPIGSWRDQIPTQETPNLTTPSAPIIQIPLDRTQSSVVTPPELRHLEPGATPPELHHLELGAASPVIRHLDRSAKRAVERPLYFAAAHAPKPLSKASTLPSPNPTLATLTGLASPQDLLRISADLTNHRCDGCRAGSNNWVVAGSHTATGAPLLSNDMHLGLTAPDIWYEAALHIDTPNGLSVEGFTLPGVPFVIVGRNPYVAWGFTNSGADVQDVLIEHLRTNGSTTEYEHPDHTWSPVHHHPELIRVRAGRDVHLDVLTTDTNIGNTTIQTPIITPLYPSERRALALAWTIYDPANITSSFLAIDSATDAASLVAAFANFTTVSQNLVYADAHHIGYHLLGRIPIRGPATQASQGFNASNNPVPQGFNASNNPVPQGFSAGNNPVPQGFSLGSHSSEENGGLQPPTTAGNNQVPQGFSAGNNQAPQGLSAGNNQLPQGFSAGNNQVPQGFSLGSHSSEENGGLQPPTTAAPTIGSPISPIPVDALDTSQTWSGYIPYNQLPAVEDPASGIIASANARVTATNYPYAITLNWADPYRVERIHHLLEADIAANHPLTPADMLSIQTDIHSEFDLLVAQRLAYALDHSAITKKNPQLQQAANILRNWNGDVTINSAAADITSAVEQELWPMLLAPQILTYDNVHYHIKLNDHQLDRILNLYTWGERRTALELILQNTPTHWLPPAFANWNDFLATTVQRGLHLLGSPHNLNALAYGNNHPIEIASPIFGSHSPITTLLGVALGTGPHPNSGDATTIKAAGLHFGPSERFTADLSNPDNTQANITTGESGNPASPHFLDQFQPWLQGTTLTLPLTHPTIQHTLTLTPQ